MSLKRVVIHIAITVAAFLTAMPAVAQTAAQRGKILVTVADPSGAIVSGATVTIVGLEPATKAATVPPAKTDDKGAVVFDRVVLGRYSIQGEFPGFELGLLRDVRIRAGDNKHVVVLPLKGMSESVTVSQDQRAAASSRPSMGLALTREQIAALSDDPDELQRQIQELAGPNATIRVDSFEGSQLPPKAQIKSIHITRDQYAAENHFIGGLFIDIVTQPGIGPIRGNGNINYNNSALNSHTKFVPITPPEQQRQFGFGIGGTLAKQKADFSINTNGNHTYSTPTTYTYGPDGPKAQALNIRTPFRQLAVQGTVNYALTRDQTIRLAGFVGGNTRRNLGIGQRDLADRGYSTKIHNRSFNFQEVGPIGRRMFLNTRAQFLYNDTTSFSVTEAPTIIINESQTTGGAQRKGGSVSKSLQIRSDLDYIRGINSWRAGVDIQSTWYQSDDSVNYLGTYTFANVDAFLAGRPLFYSKRVGDPHIVYSNIQAGVYLQDDVRVSKSLTLSPGIRYEAQTHVRDYNGLSPRFGVTWSPFKSGKTTIRGGGGVFYDWLGVGTYAQTIRIDGFHQQDLTITNPTYPDPGNVGNITTTNRYLLGPDFVLPRNLGVTVGIDQSLTSKIRVSAGVQVSHASNVARGNNENAPVNGVRPDARFLNVIETVSDAKSHSTNAYIGSSFSLTTPKPGAAQKRIDWKRLSFNGQYGWSRDRNNADGAFSVPASGTLATEWGPAAFSRPHQMFFGVNSNQVRNVNVGFNLNAFSGSFYNITTGIDNNGDQMLNDRPAGVSRNSAQVPVWNIGMSARFGYTFTFGHSAASAPQGIMITGDRGGALTVTAAPASTAGRYRVGINVSINNLPNRNNFSGYVGVLANTAQFGQPTSSGEPRRILLSMNFGF